MYRVRNGGRTIAMTAEALPRVTFAAAFFSSLDVNFLSKIAYQLTRRVVLELDRFNVTTRLSIATPSAHLFPCSGLPDRGQYFVRKEFLGVCRIELLP